MKSPPSAWEDPHRQSSPWQHAIFPEDDDDREICSVGIDLGTTNSAVAIIEDGEPVIIPNSQGGKTTPSVVAFAKDGNEVIVGENAIRQQVANKENTYYSTKRLMGLSLAEAKRRKEPLGALNVDRRPGEAAAVALKCPALGRALAPPEVAAEILNALVRQAESYLGGPGRAVRVARAVVGVPAYFTEDQMEATREAALLAGLEKVKLMREPEAAALAYGLGGTGAEDELILVFDLGGGTFDCSVLEVGGGLIEVIATSGDPHLGGNDFDKCIANWLAEEFVKQGGSDPRSDPFKMRRLLETAETSRIKLTVTKSVPVIIPFLDKDRGLDVTLTRRQMEKLCQAPLRRLLTPLREVALIAGVALDGDSPNAGEVEPEWMDDDSGPEILNQNINLKKLKKQQQKGRKESRKSKEEAKRKREQLARAIDAAGKDKKVQFMPPGRPIKQVVMVGGATRMPCIIKLVETVTGLKARTTVNPDEAVALGAAIQAGIVDGTVDGLEVMSSWQAAWLRSMALSGEADEEQEEDIMVNLEGLLKNKNI